MRVVARCRAFALGVLALGAIVGPGCSSQGGGGSAGEFPPDDQEFGTIESALCGNVTLTPNPAGPREPGTSVTFTAAAGCAVGENPQYRFEVKPPWAAYTVVQAYSSSPTFVWDTTGLEPATWRVQVSARASGSTAAWESFRNVDYRLGTTPQCTGTSFTTSPVNGTPVGGAVNFTLSSACEAGATPEYEISYRSPTAVTRVIRPWATGNTFTWDTSFLATGTYLLIVKVRSVGSTVPYQAFAQRNFQLSSGGPGPCAPVTIAASPASSANVGTNVTITGSAACEGGSVPEYKFAVRLPSGSWTTIQDYSPSNTVAWSTAGRPEGTYRLQVTARRQGSAEPWESFAETNYSLTGPAGGACISVTSSFSPPSPQAAGTSVTVNAVATCTGTASPRYRFEVLELGNGRRVLQDWSASSSATWETTGLPSGTYQVLVLVRANLSAADWEGSRNAFYVLSPVQFSCSTPRPGCGLVSTTGGTFSMGEVGAARAEPIQPNITVGPFSIDAYEVSVARFRAFWDAGAPAPARRIAYPNNNAILFAGQVTQPLLHAPNRPHCTWSTSPGTLEAHPITCVDWWTAQAFCSWDGGRLPTEAEFEWMARQQPGASLPVPRSFPYGNTAATACDVAQWNVCTGDDGRRSKRVGSFPPNAGMYDLAGNVWEWLADTWADYSDPNCWGGTARTNPFCYNSLSNQRSIRGGSWFDTNVDYQRGAWRSNKNQTTYLGPGTGFRCARN